MNLFEEYLNNENLDKRERAKLWRTSIGLQAVDNLRVSTSYQKTISISEGKFQWTK